MQIQDVQKPEVGPSEVLVRMKLRPVNPADISLIQGRMGRPPLPLTPGTEGTSLISCPWWVDAICNPSSYSAALAQQK